MSITLESASPTAPRRDRLRASERVVRLSTTAALERALARLQAREAALEERIETGDESAWSSYCQTIEALAAVADRAAEQRLKRPSPRAQVPAEDRGGR